MILGGWFFLLFIIALSLIVIFKHGEIQMFPFIFVLPITLLFGPTLLIYTDLITQKRQRFSTNYWYHYIPFFISYIIDISYFSMVGFDKLSLENYASLPYTKFLFSLRIISPIIYAQWVLAKVKLHQNRIKDEFSYFENIDLGWINFHSYGLIIINIVCIALVAVENVASYNFMFSFYYYVFVSSLCYLASLSFFGLKQRVIFIKKNTTKDLKYSATSENNIIEGIENEYSKMLKHKTSNTIQKTNKYRRNMEDLKIYEKRLYYAMEHSKLFLEPELSLAQLASHVNISTHLLSQVLNECIMMNFYDFINSYRVIEVKSKLANRSYDKYNIVVLAYESGFNSKASFQRIFKNHTGLTPTEYKRNLLQSEVEVREVEMYASLV
jgi:AraC-like DNA-binding protein